MLTIQRLNTWLIIAAFTAVVLFHILIAVIIRRRKKSRITDIPDNKVMPHDNAENEPPSPAAHTEITAPSELGEPDVTLVLTKMDRLNNHVYMVDVYDTLIVGRSRSKAGLVLPDDSRISGIHCSFRFSSNKLFITDLNSTNGTFVNGVPIRQEYRLEKGDIILIGSTQFRVNW